jgi:hypothetical protein
LALKSRVYLSDIVERRSLESDSEVSQQKNTASGDAFLAMTFAGQSLFICSFSFGCPPFAEVHSE